MVIFPIKFKRYRDWSIKFKLLIISVSLILCSVFFVSLLSYVQYTRDFEEQSADRIQQIIEQVSLNVDTYFDNLYMLSLSPYFSNDVLFALEEGPGKSRLEQLNNTRLVEDFLKSIMIIPRKDIINVFIITDNIYYSGKTSMDINTSVDPRNFYWYIEAIETNTPIFVPAHLEQMVKNPKYKVFSVVKQIRSIKSANKILGVIKVDANYTGIQSICQKVNMGQEGVLYIVDENQNIIYSSSINNKYSNNIYYKFYKEIKGREEPSFTASIGNKTFLINSTRMPRSNWTIVAINSKSELTKKASYTRNIAFFMAVVCSGFAILILFLFIKKSLNPLLAIVKLMKEIQNGNLLVKFNEATGNDEVGYLGSSFNSMIFKINEMLEQNTKLIKEVYEAKFLQKEAQINALNSQIRPHFIYNTLNMISLLVQSSKYEKAIDNINKLSTILRGMANSDKEITLRSEIDLLNSYLSIQSSRYEGRLEYSIDIDQPLLSYIIPPLIFQPVVENAIIHGCELKKERTFIRIYNTEENSNIVFNIEDDGKGMDSETLAILRGKIDNLENKDHEYFENITGKGGVGLVNVNRRIKIKYGHKYGIKIDSSPGKGTHVKIVLPKYPSEEENYNV